MNRLAYVCVGMVVLFVAASAPAFALTTSHISSDAEMLAMFSDTIFVAEGRIGDGLGNATFELDLGKATSQPEVTAQFGWPNGTSVPFTLTYNSLTNGVEFTVGNSTLNWTSPLAGYTDVFVRTRAVNVNSDIVVRDLFLDGEAVNDVSNAVGADGLDILWIRGGTLQNGFTLAGYVTMTWTGTAPTQSRLAFQIKVDRLKPTDIEILNWGRIKSLYR